MTARAVDWLSLVGPDAAPDEAVEAARTLAEMRTLALLEHPADWVTPEVFASGALARATAADGATAPLAERLRALRAADLHLALACAAGVPAAIERFERDHVVHVGDFIARVDRSAQLAEEVRQRLRARLLTGTAEAPPRIASYSARGPLGGWLRVCAVREARAIVGDARDASPGDVDRVVVDIDPEVALLKERYGALVSEAFRRALAALSPQDRTMLRMHYVDGATLEEVAAVLRVSRATGARALAKARERMVEAARAYLSDAIGASTVSANSLLAFVRSRIELDLARQLEDDAPKS